MVVAVVVAVVEDGIGSREEAAALSCWGRWSYALPMPSLRN